MDSLMAGEKVQNKGIAGISMLVGATVMIVITSTDLVMASVLGLVLGVVTTSTGSIHDSAFLLQPLIRCKGRSLSTMLTQRRMQSQNLYQAEQSS
jgi:hypothetical protein